MPMPSSPYSNLSPAGSQLLTIGDLPGAQQVDPNETEEQKRRRLVAQRQQSVSPATRLLLGGGGFGGGY